jgi:beta-glucoside operon transcriptional antiterminator
LSFFFWKGGFVVKISQILNNNVAVVKKGGSELIVYSKGISFRKKAGQSIGEDEIEKTYVLDSNDMLEHFSYLLANTDEEYLNIVNDVIASGEQLLGQKVNDYLYLTLLDHIDFALKRAGKGQFIRSPLTWEVKKFYPGHFQIGLHALKLLKERFHVEFPEDEAVSIALHFVNLQSEGKDLKETIEAMQVLKDILSIIQYHYNIRLDESSVNYMRLITHLQYFIQRLQAGQVFEDNDKALNSQVRMLYPAAYGCAG